MSNLHYYVSGNTAKGFVNFLHSNVKTINQVIVLKHQSHTLKTSVIKEIIKKYQGEYDLEILLSPLGKKYLDGVIIKDKSVAVVVDAIASTALIETTVIDLATYVAKSNEQHAVMKRKWHDFTEEAYKNFAMGLKIHDDLEAIFINEMNFKKADMLAEAFISDLLHDVERQGHTSCTYHRLFGTNTSEGAVNIVPDLLAGVDRSYFIKGRAGTGKSTFMKKVMAACQSYGFDMELYHCSFDPNSVDMVLVRDLSFCIFDSTDPHEMHPDRDGQEIIDMYKETVKDGTDEKYADKIQEVNTLYKSYMKKGIKNLKQAGEYLKQMESLHYFKNSELTTITNRIFKGFAES